MSYVYIHSENYNKNIYLFGFNHEKSMDNMYSIFLNQHYKCHGEPIYNFNKLILDLIENNTFFNFDLFLESSLISLSNEWKKGTQPSPPECESKDILCESELTFDKIFYLSQSDGNYRAHLIDVRRRLGEGLTFNYRYKFDIKQFTSKNLIDIGILALTGQDSEANKEINNIFGENYFNDTGGKMVKLVDIVIKEVIESGLYVSDQNREKFKELKGKKTSLIFL